MCVRNDDPVFLRDLGTNLHLVALDLCFVLHHVPCVEAVFQDSLHRRVRPQSIANFTGRVPVVHTKLPLVHGRVGDAKLIELLRDPYHAHAA